MKTSPKKSVSTLWLTGLALAVALVGCSNNADDGPDLEETTDASSVQKTEYIPASEEGPAQNVPEPRLPVVASEDSSDGAQATLEYFWSAIDYARLTGNVEPLSFVSHETCEFCAEHIEGWKERYEDGDWAVLHGEIEIEIDEIETHVDETQEGDWVEILFDLKEPAAELYVSGVRDDKESLQDESAAKWLADLSFDGSAQRWNVEWLGVVEPGQENTQ